jgi:RHS repeat-associated protein
MNPNTSIQLPRPAVNRPLLALLIVLGWLLAGWQAQAGNSTAFYIDSNSYSAPDNGSGSVTLTVRRQVVSGPYNDWNITASASVYIYLAGSGTYPISSSDIPSSWASGYQLVTIPAGYYSTTVTIAISHSTTPYYDRTGTFTVGNNSGVTPTNPYTNATLTVQDDNTHVGVAAYAGGYYYAVYPILEGGTSGGNSFDLRFFRDYGTSARTVNYTLSGSTAIAGTDYTPTLGMVTFATGSTYVDTTISANNASQITNKLLNVQVTGSSIYQLYSGLTNLALTIQQDFPGLGVYPAANTVLQGQSAGFVFYNTNSFAATPSIIAHYTISGTASNGVDYTPHLSGTIVIPAGYSGIETNLTATLYPSLIGAKTVTLSVSTNASYTIDTNSPSATMSILPNMPVVTIAAPTAPVQTYYTSQPAELTITRTGGPNQPLTVNYTLSGTASNGVNYATLPTSITFATNQTSTNLAISVSGSPAVTNALTLVVNLVTNASYILGLNTQAVFTLVPNSDTTNSVVNPVGRYWRGTGTDPTYWSQVIPMDSETGTVYSNLYGNAYSLYGIGAWSAATYYHYNATNSLTQTNNANRIPFNNPIAAFGERVGGTPLYVNQNYSFGIYAGDPMPVLAPVVITVYNRTNLSVAGYINFSPPNILDTNSWNKYTSNGYQVITSTNYLSDNITVTTNTYGLTTLLSDSPSLNWGTASGTIYTRGAYVLTHMATAQATNFYYVVAAYGTVSNGAVNLAQTSTGLDAQSLLYSLEFEQRPPWRSTFLDQPQFAGTPLPPFYAGKTLAEMLTNTPPVTNAVSFAPSAATNLDDSPELQRHPILDSFVASMGNDPIALANYVINQIDLTDPMDYSDNGNVAEQAINPTGVTRGALGTFMEKQGSPLDQCALLVYLLRQAGVPAVYEFAPRDGVQMLDARLSQMLKFQVHGAVSQAGQLYTTNTMIAVNYPWVAAYIGTNWVHIFPWLKDYEITEGLNLWEQMPTNYSNAYGWVHDYIYGMTNLLSLAVNGDNTPRVIFPAYLKQTLLQNHPGVSVDDLGVQILNRQHYYARWQDFPTPTWVTNVSTPLESLTASAITNISPTLTNIFDTVSIEVYSVNDPTKDIQTGPLPLVDLHNREFYIYQTATNGNQVQMNLILAPFRTNIITQYAFTNDASLQSREVLSLTLGQGDNQLNVRFKYYRHRALSAAYAIDPFQAFLGLQADEERIFERPIYKGDQAAICLDYGRVTRQMLNVHAASIWQMENVLSANPSLANSVSPDVYDGEMMYLAGMTYYEKCGEFDRVNQNLNKAVVLSQFDAGLSKISPALDNSGNLTNNQVYPVLPNVDMFFYDNAVVGNGTVQPNIAQEQEMAQQNYSLLSIIDRSAEEHQVINSFYKQTNAVSTVRLLQLAQSSGAGIVPLNVNNILAQAYTDYQGEPLYSWDLEMFQEVYDDVTAASGYGYTAAYITPGPMTNSAYVGMGALVLGWNQCSALISPQSLNGGFGQRFLYFGDDSAGNTVNYDLEDDGDYSMGMDPPGYDYSLAPDQFTYWDALNDAGDLSGGLTVLTPFEGQAGTDAEALQGLAPANNPANIAQSDLYGGQYGNLGDPNDDGAQAGSRVADPVNNITGEFYINENDLQLPGPIPLTLSRNYSSQDLANNQFGYGWKLGIMPYLSVAVGSTNIYAADMDGSVLAYVRETNGANTNLWMPTLAANPQLDNNTTAGVGGLANRLRDYLQLSITNATTNYTLYGADGSVRVYQFKKFDSGAITNERPYLQKWTDNRGNYYTFSYDTNAADANFGQMQRIQCSNGNYLGFDYDVYGHIVDSYTGDGRWIYYDYDEFGDMVTVTLPDNTTRSYQYLHSTQSVTNSGVVSQQPYSTHLIVEEDKPDGRELVNAYDSQRRVTNQWSTAGANLNPIVTGRFIYSNDFNLTNSYTNTISGSTLVIDGTNHTNRYDYTNNLITKITDPLGQTIQQVWFTTNTNAPGYYPRSVQQRTDKRGLVAQYWYDNFGNVTNTVVTGDLTGDGIATQTATNTAVYNTNCLPVQMTDPAGNGVTIVYDSVFNFLPQQAIRFAGTTPVSTNLMYYGNATNVVVNGSILQTNIALGLTIREIRAANSPDAATDDTAFNGNGFPIQTIHYSGTSDPNVTNTYFYNERGQMVNQVDALGAVTFMDYDALNRPIENEKFDESGNPLTWNFIYYTDNGEVSWVDGPRYNPEDYVFYDYDGAGRKTTEIHWRSQANSSGTGVTTPAGYNLYAQTFYQYDPLGNLVLTVDPRGAETTNTYDALCRLVQTTSLDTNEATVLSTDEYSYEPGGEVQSHTNALGGVTSTFYTTNGLPKYRINSDGSTNGWRYYLDGRIYKEIQGNGAYWKTVYDDVNRITTRTFCSAAGIPEATNSVQLDRRGNVVLRIDEGGNRFVAGYDGLNRQKTASGPAITTVAQIYPGGNPAATPYYVTNVMYHAFTNFYDAAGRVLTNLNVLGESTVTRMDALGRVTTNLVFSASGALVREQYTTYSADHNSVAVIDGSGASAISHTTWTDTDGHTVLAIANPAPGVTEFTLNQYDLAGNLVSAQHESASGGSVTPWTTASLTYDGLNRPTSKTDRDGALTTYAYDGLGDLTNRTLPGTGTLQMRATYNNSGQVLADWTVSSASVTRSNSYAYFASGTPFAGQLQTRVDGRATSFAYSYDDWLRVTNQTASGLLSEQNLSTSWQFDPRGYVTSYAEQFAGTNTGFPTSVLRSFDPYGQLATETVSNGPSTYGASQTWDAIGRRTMLNVAGGSYGYGWQADGSLIYASNPTASGSYGYDTAGLLTNRLVYGRNTAITSRDGEGRPLTIATTLNTYPELSETLAWSGDGLLATHTLARGDLMTDHRIYSYASQSRRLSQEQLNLNASTTWTNSFVYDRGVAGGPGALTTAGPIGASFGLWWSGIPDAFSHVNTETNNSIGFLAYGAVNGQSTLSAWLDSQPIQILDVGTNNMQWRTFIELSQGAHQLKVSALHPSGFFTAWATNAFTNNIPNQVAHDGYDGGGNITNRVWVNASGLTNRMQILSYDAKGRLHQVIELNTNNYGFIWTASYDALNRRLSTTTTLVSNNVPSAVPPQVLSSYYDPLVEFLELGVQLNSAPQVEFLQAGTSPSVQTVWKLYGPDLNGAYGGENGTGGLEGVSPYLNTFNPVISDARGNVLAEVTNGVPSWTLARPTGYGAVPGYRPVAYGNGVDLAQSCVFRGREVDVTGYHHFGMRDYDPVSGQWLSYDPAWNDRDPNGQSYCGGDPINGFDPDGRTSASLYQTPLPNMAANFFDQGGSGGITGLYDQSAGFRAAVGELFGPAQNAYGQSSPDFSFGDFSYSERMGILDVIAGGNPETDDMSPDVPTQSAGAMATVGNAVFNTDNINFAANQWNNANWQSGMGIAIKLAAGTSYVANRADSIANMVPIVGGLKMGLETALKVGSEQLAKQFGEDAAKSDLKIASYNELKNDASIPGQAHHLNQNAAYNEIIPTGEGVSTKLEGNAFTDVDSPHYNAHESLEEFWDQFRPGGDRYRELPTNLEYTQALADSLQAAGLSEAEVQQAVRAAVQQQLDYGLLGGMSVPRIPGRINQVAR